MGLLSDPLQAIFPIFKVSQDKAQFLGTGFLVHENGLFLTAKHVFEENPLGSGDSYVVVNMLLDENAECSVTEVRFARDFDIACGRVNGFSRPYPLQLANQNAPVNDDVLTIEFSQTIVQPKREGIEIRLRPYSRKGYVHAYYEDELPRHIPTKYLDLSFPALKGASGAPVLNERDGSVLGLIVANVERELLPAQVETVVDQQGQMIEERKYFLPTGRAIAWNHLKDFLNPILTAPEN